jgi:hypothetical protein
MYCIESPIQTGVDMVTPILADQCLKKMDSFSSSDIDVLISYTKKDKIDEYKKNFDELDFFVKSEKSLFQAMAPQDPVIDQILYSYLPWVKAIEEPAVIKFQIVHGAGFLLPHRDINRCASIFIPLNINTGVNYFYKDITGNKSTFSLPSNLRKVYTKKMHLNQAYLFDHSAIHGLYLRQSPKLSLALSYYKTPVDQLYNILKQYNHAVQS